MVEITRRLCRCGCGKPVLTPGREYSAGHNPGSFSVEAHARQAAAISGENNPAKRPEVRRRIAEAVKANHPSRTHQDLWSSLARNMKPTKVSRLEVIAARCLPGYKAQQRIGRYTVDFVNYEQRVAVEVNGCWYHCCPTCHPEGPQSERQRLTVQNYVEKREYLLNAGWWFMEVWEHELKKELA